MLIELHIRRISKKTGQPMSEISLGNTKYIFEPNPKLTDGDDEAHVCDVQDTAHIKRLLSIREFTIYGEQPEPDEEEVFNVEEMEAPEEDGGPAQPTEEEVDLEQEMCETIISMTVTEAKAHLNDLSDAALDTLETMERAGSARSTLLAAIEDERQERADQE